MRLVRLLISISLPAFIGAVMAGIAGGIALTGTIALVNYALNNSLWQHFNSPAMAASASIIIASVAWLTYLAANTVSILMQRSLAKLRTSLCERIIEGKLVNIETSGQSTLVALFTEDLSKVAQGAFALPMIVVNLSICTAAFFYLAAVHLGLCIVVLVTQIATMGITAVCFRRFKIVARAATEERHKLVANYHLMTSSIKELKQSVKQRNAFRTDLFEANVREAMVKNQDLDRLGSTMDAIAKAGFLLTIAAFFVLAAAIPSLATEAELRSVVLGFIFMATPLAAAINGTPQLLEANMALHRIDKFELAPEPPCNTPSYVSCTVRMVALVNACFSYAHVKGGSGFRCGPLNLTLRRGEILTLSGGNGSGKTTAAKCLAGLYELDAGVLSIDDQEVPANARSAFRELFTVVWSENTLSHYHLPTKSDQTGIAAWSLLGLNEVAPYTCGWFDCSALSTGQRRRVALAAALMDPRPFLILDEWSANQDKEFRELFYDKLLPQLREAGHGILLITHDAVSLRTADRAIYMDDGLIVDSTAVTLPTIPLQHA